MSTVNGIFDLPGRAQTPVDQDEPSRVAVPRYFAEYELAFSFPILRPVRVTAVRDAGSASSPLSVETTAGTWTADALINATGTWDNPLRPWYPGIESFQGVSLHTREYRDAEEFAGLRVGIVGAGISAIQHLDEISRVTRTTWYTRREPEFIDGPFTPETTGRATIAKVRADAEAGIPVGSIVSYTGLSWSKAAVDARTRGVLVPRPMFSAMDETGVIHADGTRTALDVVLWATGFRPSLAHLSPLGLENSDGVIRVRGTAVATDPRIHLIGFGPSQSTVGANRAGREAATAVARRAVSRL